MKKQLLLLVMMLLPMVASADVEINEENFPDANFRSYLLSQSYGADGKITESEIKNIVNIDVYNKGIISLKGVEFFTALTNLSCYRNQLTALDVSKNTALTWLDCGDNKLTALDVSKNTALTSLGCSYNQLTALDVSKNTALGLLDCGDNKLTALDVSKNTALRTLECYNNQLTILDVSKNTALTYLACYLNQIKGTDMDNLINSLPNNMSGKTYTFRVYYQTDKEGNVCTTSQAVAAKAKGWIPLYFDGKQWLEYVGSEPERPSYSLTYVVDGETYKTYSIKEGEAITPEPAPTKEGYTFSGWSNIPETMPAHDVTVTGSFTVNKYKLIYTVDNEVYKSYEIEYGTTITPEPTPIKEGYTFSGWSWIPSKMPAEDVIVTGSFSINKYKLTYIVDGEVYKSYNVEYGASITPETEPTKEGFTFSGWSWIPAKMPAEDVTITGSFTINQYTITYMIDNEVYTTEKVNYGTMIIPPSVPEREGYDFAWGDYPETMPAYDITIYGAYTTGIEAIMAGEYGNVQFYSPDGKLLDKPQKGLNIVRMSNGNIKKVVVK